MKLPLLAAALALTVSLGACATTPISRAFDTAQTVLQAKVLNPFNDASVAALGVTIGTADSLVITYGALPLCPKGQTASLGERDANGNLCHDAKVLKSMYAAMTAVGNDHGSGLYAQLVAMQKTHPQGSVVIGGTLHDKFVAVQRAVAVLTDLTNAYVAKGA